MKASLLFFALSMTGTHADVPWLKALAVCNASIAGRDGREGVMRFSDGAATPKQKDESLVYLGENVSAFVGENGKRAGLWIVSEREAYFADLEGIAADTKQAGSGVWSLKIREAGRPPLHSAFGYFDAPDESRRWKMLTAAHDTSTTPIGDQQKGQREVEARKFVTPELQAQMETRIMRTLKRWADSVVPGGPSQEAEEIAAILRALEKHQLTKQGPANFDRREERNLEREKGMVDGIRACRKAIEGRKEFGNMAAMMNLVERHVATKRELNPHRSDDTKPDAAL